MREAEYELGVGADGTPHTRPARDGSGVSSTHERLCMLAASSSPSAEPMVWRLLSKGQTLDEHVMTLEAGGSPVQVVACSGSGGSGAKDQSLIALGGDAVTIVDAQSGKRLGLMDGHDNQVTSLEFSPDSALLATASLDGTIVIWNARASEEKLLGKKMHVLREHEDQVNCVRWSPDSKVLASIADDAGGGRMIRALAPSILASWCIALHSWYRHAFSGNIPQC